MEREEEAPEHGLPFEDYFKDDKKLRQHAERLGKEYDAREKVIGRIMQFGTGIETEKALRMYTTPGLTKWKRSLRERLPSKSKAVAQP